MAINVNNSASRFFQQQLRPGSDKKQRNAEIQRQESNITDVDQVQEDESPAAQLMQFAQATDEMSAILTQFNNRRAFERKNAQSGETSFDQVLQEDIEPRLDKLMTILQSSEGGNIENSLRQAFALFPDESDLAMVLREKLRQRNLEEIVRQRLQKLLAHLEKEADPKRLKAGINVALKARLFAKALSLSPALVRESYREFLQSNDHQTQIYQGWVQNYGAEKRAIIIEFMQQALVSDIEASDPSCSHIEFSYLLGRMRQIREIRSCDILFIDGLRQAKPLCSPEYDERELLFFLFAVLLYPDSLNEIVNQTFGEDLARLNKTEQATFLQTLYRACRALPVTLFYEEEYREALLENFMALTDEALLQENIARRFDK